MKRYLVFAGYLAFATGCGGAKTHETGPKINASIDCNFDTARSGQDDTTTIVTHDCAIDTEKNQYSITLTIDMDDGDKHDESGTAKAQNFPAKPPTVTIAVDGAALPAPTFKTEPAFESSRLTGDPFTIPATSKGKALTVHIETSDSRGLKSNTVDFKITLN